MPKLSMPLNITIDPTDQGSDSSLTDDEENSSGVQVSPPSESGSHGGYYDEWARLPYPDELKPSDSASRPRTSHRTRHHPIHGSRSVSGRRPSRRQIVHERGYSRRPRRQPSSESPESEDSSEEYMGHYGRAPPDRRYWPQAQAPGYAHSSSSGPSYGYPPASAQHGAYPRHPDSAHAPSDQLIRFGHHNQMGQPAPYGHPLYGYGAHYGHPHGAPMSPYFPHDHHPGNHANHPQAALHARSEGHGNPRQHLPPTIPSRASPPPYGDPALHTQDLVPYGQAGYYPYRDPYAMVPGMMPPYYGAYPRPPSPGQPESAPSSPPPPPADAAKDEAIARLERLILEERTEREAREAREAERQAAIEQEAADAAAREERAAHEKKIVEEAAALARAEAEQKAAEEAAQAKKEAEEAAATAASEAAAAATEAANAAAAEAVAAAAAAAVPPPPEKKKPIKFKDAVGRKFSFPFDLCYTWKGMEELIKQAFLHIEGIGPHVADGHYDLVGPNGDIILPQVWETVVEPDWTITMHMWPLPEKPKEPEPGAPAEATPTEAPAEGAEAAAEEAKKPAGPKKPRKAQDPGAFAMWVVGNRGLRGKNLKV